MKPIFHATDKEAVEIRKGNSIMRVRPLREQPPEGYELHFTDELNAWFALPNEVTKQKHDLSYSHYCEAIPLRYSTGTYMMYAPRVMVIGREWDDFRKCKFTIPVFAGYELDVKTTIQRLNEIDWWDKSPICEWDSKSPNPVVWAWNKKYGKPRKTKDGNGYVIMPYTESEQLLGTILNAKCAKLIENIHGTFTYKGLPLAIYPNPYVEINVAERRKIK